MTNLILFLVSLLLAGINLSFWPDPGFALIAGGCAVCGIITLWNLIETLEAK